MIALAEPRGLASDAAGLARALETVPIAVALFDRELRLVRANDRFRALTGCPGGPCSQLAPHEIFPTALATMGPVLAAAGRGRARAPQPVAFTRPGGGGTVAEVSVVRLTDALERDGCREDGLLFVATEPGGPDEAARRAGVATDGDVPRANDAMTDAPPSLPRAVAHDLSNLLGLIGNAAHLIALRADDPAAVREYATRIAAAVERGAALLGHGAAAVATGAAGAPAGRVLVVEDDDDGRDFMTALVTSAGRPVVAVQGVAEARAALERAAAADAPFSLLVTDVSLEDGCGWSLAAEVRQRWPALRVGVVTGWDAAEDRDVGAHFVLHKPIRVDDLLAQVASAS